jgi:hypothetical protein
MANRPFTYCRNFRDRLKRNWQPTSGLLGKPEIGNPSSAFLHLSEKLIFKYFAARCFLIKSLPLVASNSLLALITIQIALQDLASALNLAKEAQQESASDQFQGSRAQKA